MQRLVALCLFLCAFLSSIALSQVTTEHQPALIGGKVANPADWPASPWVGNCSSTIVGPSTLLIAAHCIDRASVSFTIGTTRYSAACTIHPEYRSNYRADWALCQVSSPVTGVPFEIIAKETDAACARSKKYLLTGYGCTVWGGPLDGQLRTGEAATTICPSGGNYYVETVDSVALCSGDSGGAGFVELDDGRRYIVGVNSRSDTRVTSLISATYTQSFLTWARNWADARGTKICGIHEDALGCRGATRPDPEPLPGCERELFAADEAFGALKACLGGRSL